MNPYQSYHNSTSPLSAQLSHMDVKQAVPALVGRSLTSRSDMLAQVHARRHYVGEGVPVEEVRPVGSSGWTFVSPAHGATAAAPAACCEAATEVLTDEACVLVAQNVDPSTEAAADGVSGVTSEVGDSLSVGAAAEAQLTR